MTFEELKIWDALPIWRDSIFQNSRLLRSTREKYLSAMYKLIEAGAVDPQMTISNFLAKGYQTALDRLKNQKDIAENTKRIRREGLNNFRKFIDKLDSKELKKLSSIPLSWQMRLQELREILSSNEDKPKTQKLSQEEWSSFFEEIKKISLRDYYISLIIWHTRLSLKQILELKLNQFDPETGQIGISLEDGKILTGTTMPREIWKTIWHYLNANNRLLNELAFQTATGKPIHSTQITRNMKKACKKVGLSIIISPKVLHAWSRAYYNEHMAKSIHGKEYRQIIDDFWNSNAEQKRAFERLEKNGAFENFLDLDLE